MEKGKKLFSHRDSPNFSANYSQNLFLSQKNKSSQKKVVVAMSGGVDSSVAAAILKKEGYEVVGVFMHFWHEPVIEISGGDKSEKRYIPENRCCSIESQEMARRVAQRLDIPFYTLNFKEEFKKYVVDYFISGYKMGLTPNPCVMCNKFIKFDFLLKKARLLGADYLATGHYARIGKEILESKKLQKIKSPYAYKKAKDFSTSLSNLNFVSCFRPKTIYRLLKAKDKNKDQSYFLYNLIQQQLAHLLFPIGDYTKEEVRQMAKKWHLPVALRRESQEICFIPEKDYSAFLKRHLKDIKPGKIIDQNGKILGEHQGLPFYTLGQRKKIGAPGGPYFVFEKDIKRNILYVTNILDDKKLYSREIIVGDVNWVRGTKPKLPLFCKIKIRYRSEEVEGEVLKNLGGNQYQIRFQKPVYAATPGQSAVFFWGEEVLGGGVIKTRG